MIVRFDASRSCSPIGDASPGRIASPRACVTCDLVPSFNRMVLLGAFDSQVCRMATVISEGV